MDQLKLNKFVNQFIVEPVKAEIESGRLDNCISLALLRVTFPLIILIIILVAVSITHIVISVRVMRLMVAVSCEH